MHVILTAMSQLYMPRIACARFTPVQVSLGENVVRFHPTRQSRPTSQLGVNAVLLNGAGFLKIATSQVLLEVVVVKGLKSNT